ncbi:trypsin-like peptidase domain-containing protein [Pelomonas sp. SE-A7]|uniref:S1C family serine protease n=1 Tax=Pelomonas sp. SE-A7 TaxID=3054953 RepID=UPI00259D1657|nr:trypsin-like peptidase domain-containing protein [Pelomonas sp. SE-A7]MDM4768041.1 trypsin-like peptidase domain-containing protein [Pelomonas sp. SE-A7]
MFKNQLRLLAGSLALCAPLAFAWDLLPPPQVTQKEARSVQGSELKAKLAVDKIKIGLLQGDELGSLTAGWFCGNRQPLTVNENYSKSFGTTIATLATQELKRLGYPMAGPSDANAFETDVGAAPDYRIGGVLKQARYEICQNPVSGETEGWIHLKIDWALYSEREQKVVFQLSTEGLAFSKEKIRDLSKRAVLSTFANFLAAPEILSTMTTPIAASAPVAAAASAPATTVAAAPTAAEPAATGTDGPRAMTLKGSALPRGGALKNQNMLRAAVVTLETSAGSGSGFYIDREGYLLTNAHVVKGAKFAKVKLPNGDKLVAQIIKINERTDVALLKTPSVDLTPLALRKATLDIGEDVFAIGSPLGVLTSSMTKGVLSADRVLEGRRVLQSDAAVTFGSSGGPLLDSDGAVVGLTQGGVASGKGFNFFIPIQDALRVLDVAVKAE